MSKKISELNLVTTPADDDSFAGVQGGENYEFLTSQILRSPVDVHNAKHYGATGDGATDDTVALQAAIDAVPTGGLLWIPNGKYNITSALVVSDHITICGASMVMTHTPSGGIGTPSAPYIEGVQIEQQTAATDAIQLSGAAICVNLRNIGIGFGAAIRNTNTGHGINGTPSTMFGLGHDYGVMEFEWNNIAIYGGDGNHYGVYLVNPILGTVRGLRVFNGGGVYIECDSYEGNFGNLVFVHTYISLLNAGTADAYRLVSRTAFTEGTGHLNLLTFIRPQANITGAAAAAGTQYFWNNVAGTDVPARVDLVSPNFEGAGANPLDFGGIAGGTTMRRGGLINPTPVGGADGDIGFEEFTANGTFIVPDSIFRLRIRVVGGGGGGGGGGTNVGAAVNSGAGGGGAAMVTEGFLSVVPRASYAITIGAGGAGGGGGAAGGNAGGAGGTGAQSSFGGDIRANGGGGGDESLASSAAAVGGGQFARTGSNLTWYIPGTGGQGRNAAGLSSYPMPPGVVGGAGAGNGTAANGGGGGAASLGIGPAYAAMAGGASGASGDANGVNGTTATTPGCGGGGGGGAPAGGAGGDGGDGADGKIEITW